MPSTRTDPVDLHIHDFINHVDPDPTRPGKGLSMQLHVPLTYPTKTYNQVTSNKTTFPLRLDYLVNETGLTFTN
jgi:hypothetical protein